MALIPFSDMPGFAEHHDSHLAFLKVEGKAEEISRKLDHLIELHLAEALDLGDAITDFPDGPHVGLGDPGRDVCDFLFQFLKDITHDSGN